MDFVAQGKLLVRSPFTMVKLTETASTKSSTVSSKAGSLKQAARKGAKALIRPFKKLKKSISVASARSRSSTALFPSDDEGPINGDRPSIDGGSIHGSGSGSGSDPEVKLTPEQELGE